MGNEVPTTKVDRITGRKKLRLILPVDDEEGLLQSSSPAGLAEDAWMKFKSVVP